ncbi:Ctr copper transporter family-domain-containing protein [Entophlyctis helioformis]|nr:Ctr copper transporter family-domain-containing protein [Entophlyctis helioformis]
MAHQHGGGAGHAAGGAGAGGPSGMVWNWDTDMTILFPFWQTHGTMSMLASSLGIAVVCFLLEWFKEYRHINDPLWIEQLERTAYSSSVDTDDNASDVELATAQPSWASDQTHHRGGSGASPSKHSPSSSSATVHHRHDQWQSWKLQLIRTSAYMLELGASLIIMSIFMLLNGWISIAIIVGTGSGFFLFRMGLRPKSLVHPSGGGHGGAMASGSASRHTAASTSSC